ncbi:MAG: 4-hydroxythreonine-4-phosphate dehydrogenase PdxA [bacterium]
MVEENSFIGVTSGDPGGVGPEIAIKSSEYFIKAHSCIRPVIFGSLEEIGYVSKKIIKTTIPLNLINPEQPFGYSYKDNCLNIVELSSMSYAPVKFGVANPEYAKDVERFIESAVNFSLSGKISGFATAPINKDMMLRGGARFGGHTELLGYLTSSDDFAMLFYSKKIITVLVTIHIPLSSVPHKITKDLLRKIINISVNSMRTDFGIENPHIAVLALNPHAGENGGIGNEEKDTIEPVIEESRNKNIDIEGPFPADSFFAKKYKDFNLIVSMYHDQALIPFKLLSFNKGVNVTAGLRIIRTSPVHGTAYDIAGKNIADCGSMIESIKLVHKISRNRNKWIEK